MLALDALQATVITVVDLTESCRLGSIHTSTPRPLAPAVAWRALTYFRGHPRLLTGVRWVLGGGLLGFSRGESAGAGLVPSSRKG